MSSARCPLPLDPPWSPGGVDQQVLQELPAAQEKVCQGRSGDPGFGHSVVAAIGQGGTDLPELPADVGRHYGGAFSAQWPGWLHGGILQRSQRSLVPEIIQGLTSCSFPMDPAETVFGKLIG